VANRALTELEICDDDESLIYWLETKLMVVRGFNTCSTFEGDEAFAAYCRNRPFDYVLTDYLFTPGQRIKNGLDLVKAIWEIDPTQRIIMQTSEQGFRPPCHVIYKPYPLQRLLRHLKKPEKSTQGLLFQW
jgi:ActR/RegA family two-component response regulator